MTGKPQDWPECRKCHRNITLHYLHGWNAYCDEDKAMKSTFTVTEINRLRAALGHPVSNKARAMARAEAKPPHGESEAGMDEQYG